MKLYIRIVKVSQTLFCRSPVEVQSNEPEPSVPKEPRILMDFAREESSWPRSKNGEQIPTLKSYIQKFLCDQSTTMEYLEAIIENTKIQSKSILFDSLLIICQSKITGARSQDVEQLKNLLQAIVELI